jgi:putative copper export protein
MLEGVTASAKPWFAVSLLVFIVTGTYLLLVNEQYLGVGDFGNTWSILMLVKHIAIIALIGLGAYTDRVVTPRAAQEPAAVGRLQLMFGATALCGVVVLLLTVAAQAT